MDDAIERARRIQRKVRDRVAPRLAFPERFAELERLERIEEPVDQELENFMWDRRV